MIDRARTLICAVEQGPIAKRRVVGLYWSGGSWTAVRAEDRWGLLVPSRQVAKGIEFARRAMPVI